MSARATAPSRSRMPPIKFAQIEPVGQCNLRCRMCPVQFRPDGAPQGPLAFMEVGLFRRLLDEMPELQVLHLQGLGEPLMHPQFFDMVQDAARRGVKVSTNTNLTLLSARRARLCVESGLAELHASLDGATPETYEHIRLDAQFCKVKRHLQELLRVREEIGASTPSVRLVMVVMRENLHELADVVDLAHSLGVNSLFVQHLCHDFGESDLPERYRPMRRFVEEQSLLNDDPARIERCFGRARERAATHGLDLRLPRTVPRPAAEPSGCDWPWRGPYISYDGQTMPCCMIGTPDRTNLGAVAHESVQAVWDGEAYREFRRALASERPPDVCRSCAVYHGVF